MKPESKKVTVEWKYLLRRIASKSKRSTLIGVGKELAGWGLERDCFDCSRKLHLLPDGKPCM